MAPRHLGRARNVRIAARIGRFTELGVVGRDRGPARTSGSPSDSEKPCRTVSAATTASTPTIAPMSAGRTGTGMPLAPRSNAIRTPSAILGGSGTRSSDPALRGPAGRRGARQSARTRWRTPRRAPRARSRRPAGRHRRRGPARVELDAAVEVEAARQADGDALGTCGWRSTTAPIAPRAATTRPAWRGREQRAPSATCPARAGSRHQAPRRRPCERAPSRRAPPPRQALRRRTVRAPWLPRARAALDASLRLADVAQRQGRIPAMRATSRRNRRMSLSPPRRRRNACRR